VLEALRSGWQLGISFNPLASACGAAIAAMLLVRNPGPLRWVLAVCVIAGAWFLGEGRAVLELARDLDVRSAGLSSAAWAEIVLWSGIGLLLGYVLPTWAGVFVGRRVTWGTGWASAGAVAVMASGVATALARAVGS